MAKSTTRYIRPDYFRYNNACHGFAPPVKKLGSDMMQLLTGEEAGTPFDNLSIRELEIMNLLVEGKNVTDIAAMLFCIFQPLVPIRQNWYNYSKSNN